VSGRHSPSATRRHRYSLLLSVATVLGVWLGVSAPNVSPVAAPVPVAQVQPVDGAVPAGPLQGAQGPDQGLDQGPGQGPGQGDRR
jgi:hypothetical protein